MSTANWGISEKFSELIQSLVLMLKSAHPAEWYTKDEFRLKFSVGQNRARELAAAIRDRNLSHRLVGANGRQVIAPLESWLAALSEGGDHVGA